MWAAVVPSGLLGSDGATSAYSLSNVVSSAVHGARPVPQQRADWPQVIASASGVNVSAATAVILECVAASCPAYNVSYDHYDCVCVCHVFDRVALQWSAASGALPHALASPHRSPLVDRSQ